MRVWACTVAVVVLGLIAMPTAATKYTYVVSGVVDASNSVDELGYFGSLDDQAFTASFLLDDHTPGAVFTRDAAGSSASGGDQFLAGTRSPLAGQLTIGGRTVPIPQGNFFQPANTDPVTGDPYGEQIIRQDLGQATKDAAAGTLVLASAFSSSTTQVMLPYSAYDAYDLAVRFSLQSSGFRGPGFDQVGTFTLAPASFGSFAATASGGYHNDQYFSYSFIALNPTSLTVTASAVPELAGWAYMIVGLGLAGGAARARRRPAAMRAGPA